MEYRGYEIKGRKPLRGSKVMLNGATVFESDDVNEAYNWADAHPIEKPRPTLAERYAQMSEAERLEADRQWVLMGGHLDDAQRESDLRNGRI